MQDVTRNRDLPFQRRGDLQIQPLLARGFRFCVVKDPLALRYWKLDPAQYCILSWLDGTATLESLRIRLQAEFPGWHITLRDIQQLVLDLQQKGLLITRRAYQAATLLANARDHRMRAVLQAIQNPLFIRFPGVDPNRFLGWLNSVVGWILHPVMIIVWALFILTVWGLIYVRSGAIWQQLPSFEQFFAWPNVMYLWLVLGATKIIHELAHGLATKRIGRDCHTIGAALLVFSPTMYCDATDSWMVSSKWKRVGVAAAGMFVEVLLASAAFLLWSVTLPGVLKHLLLNIFFVSTVSTVIFNANPLIRFDGYYMLSDWLEIPNLSEVSRDVLSRGMGWCLGLDIENTSRSPAPLWILITYGIAAFIYRWFLLLSIGLGMYIMFAGFELASVGAALAFFAIGGSSFNSARNFRRLFKRHSKGEPIHKGRCSLTVVAVLTLMSAILWVPIPVYRTAPAYAEPDGIRHVYNNRDGQFGASYVSAGDRVKIGDPIALLKNAELEDRARKLTTELGAVRSELLSADHAEDHATVVAKEEEANQLAALLAEVRHQLGQNRIVAPITGEVIWPERVARATREQRESSLTGWQGLPLHPENLQCMFAAGTHLCSISPDPGSFVAKILVDQQDRNDLRVGSIIRIKFDSQPYRVVSAKVGAIARQHSEVVPRLMSLKRGGKIATVTDSMGQERLNSNAYLVTAAWDADTEFPLRTAMRGQARFWVGHRSTSEWIRRWIQSTFSFRI